MAIRIFEMACLRDGKPLYVAPFIASQTGTVSGTSAQSSAFSSATNIVAVQTDEDCHVLFGPNPTATTAGFKIAAGETREFNATPGDKVAWIAA